MKQVSIQISEDIIKRAKEVARQTKRSDGLKQTTTAILRHWLIKGMEAQRATNQ